MRPENFLLLVHEIFEALIYESFKGIDYEFYIPCTDCLQSVCVNNVHTSNNKLLNQGVIFQITRISLNACTVQNVLKVSLLFYN